MNTDSREQLCEKPGDAGGKATVSLKEVKTKTDFNALLGMNSNKKVIDYAFVLQMKKRFLKCRFNESKNYVMSVMKSTFREGIYLYDFPLFPLCKKLTKEYCQSAEILRPILKGMVDTGFFNFLYIRGKHKFMPYWNRFLKGEVWNPWIDKRIGTLSKDSLWAVKRIYKVFDYLPGWVKEQGKTKYVTSVDWLKLGGVTCVAAASTILCGEIFSPMVGIAAGLLTVGCATLTSGIQLTNKVSEAGTKICENMIDNYKEQIMEKVRSFLPHAKYVIPIAMLGSMVLGYLVYRLVKYQMLDPEVTLVYLKGMSPGNADITMDLDDIALVREQNRNSRGFAYLALTAVALAAGVSFNVVSRNYGSCKAIFTDVCETFCTDNIKELLNWLADLMGFDKVFESDNTWAKINEINEYISQTQFDRKMLNSPDDWNKCMDYCRYVDSLPTFDKEWSNTEVVRVSQLKGKMQKIFNDYSGCDPVAMNRIQPVVVFLKGPTRQGKTNLARLVAKKVHSLLYPDKGYQKVSDYMISISQVNFPWESYIPNKHMAVLQDDFLQKRDASKNGDFLEELYKILQDTPYVCQTAFGDKGKKRYKARVHIFTSNIDSNTMSSMGVNSREAFFSRMDVCVNVKLNANASVKDFENSWTLDEWQAPGYICRTDGKSFGLAKLFELVEDAYHKHAKRETASAIDGYALPPTKHLSPILLNSSSSEDEESDDYLVTPVNKETKFGVVGGIKTAAEQMFLAKTALDKYDVTRKREPKHKEAEMDCNRELEDNIVMVKEQGLPRKTPIFTEGGIRTYVYFKNAEWNRVFTEPDSVFSTLVPEDTRADLKVYYDRVLPLYEDIHMQLDISVSPDLMASKHTLAVTTEGKIFEVDASDVGQWPTHTAGDMLCNGIPRIVQSQCRTCDRLIQRKAFMKRLTGHIMTGVAFAAVIALVCIVGTVVVSCIRGLAVNMPFLVSEQSATGDYSREKTKVYRRGDNVRKTCASPKCNKVMKGAAKYCHSCGTPVTEQSLFYESNNYHKQEVANKVLTNVWQLIAYTDDGLESRDHILMLDDQHGVAAKHTLARNIRMLVLQRGKSSKLVLERENFSVQHFEGQHTSVLTLLTRRLASVRSIRSHLLNANYDAKKGEVIQRHDMYTTEDGDIELDDCTGLVVANTLGTNYHSASGKFEINSGVLTDIKDNYDGLCGTPYFMDTADGFKVTHIHVAADNSGASLASSVSLAMIPDNAIQLVNTQNFCVKSLEGESPKGTNHFGKSSAYMFVGNKSSYRESMFRTHEEVDEVNSHIPMQNAKPRAAMNASMRFKYKENILLPESLLREMKLTMEDLMSDFRPEGKFKTLPIEEAIFGNGMLEPLEHDTSVGPYLRSLGINKRTDLFDKATKWIHPYLKYLVYRMWDAYSSGVYEEFIISLALKDEPLPMRKSIKRIFTVFDLHVLIFMRMLLGDLFGEQILRHNQSSCCIGINPHCVDWTILATELQKWPWLLDSDFSKFDVTIQEYILDLFADYISKRAPIGKEQMVVAVIRAATSPTIVCGEEMYSATFNPSGWLLTLLANDFVNRFAHKFCIYKILESKGVNFLDHQDEFICKTYGDDAIKSCSTLIKENVSAKELQHYMLHIFGMHITAGDKNGVGEYYSDIADAEFIGRTFRKVYGWYLAPLGPKSFNKMLHWVRKSKNVSEYESYQAIINSLLFESIPRGEDHFNLICRIIDSYSKEHFFKKPFADYQSAWNYYLDSYLKRKVSPLSYEKLTGREGPKA